MMARHSRSTNWIDDAFDDEKMQQEIEEAKRSRNTGCLVSVIVFVVVAITLTLVGINMLATI